MRFSAFDTSPQSVLTEPIKACGCDNTAAYRDIIVGAPDH
jgi:hypothetical protein